MIKTLCTDYCYCYYSNFIHRETENFSPRKEVEELILKPKQAVPRSHSYHSAYAISGLWARSSKKRSALDKNPGTVGTQMTLQAKVVGEITLGEIEERKRT